MILVKTYGKIFRIRIGNRNAVVLNDYKTIKDACSRKEFLDRPENSTLEYFDRLFPNFSSVSGHQWKEERRFAFHTLKDMGLDKHNLETFVQDTIQELMKHINQFDGKPCNTEHLIQASICNIISLKVMGVRFELKDPKAKKIQILLDSVAKRIAVTGVLTFMPWLGRIVRIFNFAGFKEAYKAQKELGRIFDEYIADHKQSFDPENICDYIDHYLKEKEAKEAKGNYSFNDVMLRGNAFVLFGTGAETSSSAIQWLLLLMANYPEIQEKVRQEIIELIGTERLPSLEDKKSMPYVNAVIMEMQRWATLAPVGVYRSASKDIDFQGYDIKKDTIVFFNLYAMHHDPEYWVNPEEFNPERFLDTNGKLMSHVKSYAPFALGKRSCPGEFMAEVEMFLFFTSLLQKYKITPPAGQKVELSPVIAPSPVRQPKMQELCLCQI